MMDQRTLESLLDELDSTQGDACRAPLLVELLGRAGHERHEDIVFELGLIGAPEAVDAIAKAATHPSPYVDELGQPS